MKIGSTPKPCDNEFGIDIELMQKIGFETIDLQDFTWSTKKSYSLDEDSFINYYSRLKNELDKHHLIVNQMHGLFEFQVFKWDLKENWESSLFYYIRSFKAAQILGCKYVVLHHRHPKGYDENEWTKENGFKYNIEFLNFLAPYAEQYGVTICLENLPFSTKHSNVLNTYKIVKEVNKENVGMCLDLGHLNVTEHDKNIFDVVTTIGDKLKVLHVHDNLGDGDYHLLPGQGNINWREFARALKAINFQGSFSYETASRSKDPQVYFDEETSLVKFAHEILGE